MSFGRVKSFTGRLKNSLRVLRLRSGRTESFDMIEDFPFMLTLSKHSEPFSTACFTLTFESNEAMLANGGWTGKEQI